MLFARGKSPKILFHDGKKEPVCATKHLLWFTRYTTNVVYCILLTCNNVYIVQTGRCFNEWVKEGKSGHLAVHCGECKLIFWKSKFVGRGKDQSEGEVIELFQIRQAGSQCVSTPSLLPHNNELVFIESRFSTTWRTWNCILSFDSTKFQLEVQQHPSRLACCLRPPFHCAENFSIMEPH